MRDTAAYLRQLKERGYRFTGGGRKHIRIYWGQTWVATASASPGQGNRSLENLKGQVRRFERSQRQAQEERATA